jgi:hypothetical protein
MNRREFAARGQQVAGKEKQNPKLVAELRGGRDDFHVVPIIQEVSDDVEVVPAALNLQCRQQFIHLIAKRRDLPTNTCRRFRKTPESSVYRNRPPAHRPFAPPEGVLGTRAITGVLRMEPSARACAENKKDYSVGQSSL